MYSYNYSTLQIRTFDLDGLPPFAELTPQDTIDPGVLRMTISQDGGLLFLVGTTQFIVRNMP